MHNIRQFKLYYFVEKKCIYYFLRGIDTRTLLDVATQTVTSRTVFLLQAQIIGAALETKNKNFFMWTGGGGGAKKEKWLLWILHSHPPLSIELTKYFVYSTPHPNSLDFSFPVVDRIRSLAKSYRKNIILIRVWYQFNFHKATMLNDIRPDNDNAK